MAKTLNSVIDLKIKAHNETSGAINEIKKNLIDIENSSKNMSSSVSGYMVKDWDALNKEINNIVDSITKAIKTYDSMGNSDVAGKLSDKLAEVYNEFNKVIAVRNDLSANPFGLDEDSVKINEIIKDFRNIAKEARICSDDTAKELGKIGQSLDEQKRKLEENIKTIEDFKIKMSTKIDTAFFDDANKYFDKMDNSLKAVKELKKALSEKAEANFFADASKFFDEVDEKREKLNKGVQAVQDFKKAMQELKKAMAEKAEANFFADAKKYFDEIDNEKEKVRNSIKVLQDFKKTMSEKAEANFFAEAIKYFDELDARTAKLNDNIQTIKDFKRAMAEKADADFFNQVSAEWEKESKDAEEHLKGVTEQWQYMFGNTTGAMDSSALQQLSETGLGAKTAKDRVMELAGAFTNLAIQGNLSVGSIQSLLKTFGASSVEIMALIAVIKLASESFEYLKKQYEEMVSTIKNIGANVLNGLKDSINLVTDAFSFLGDSIDEAINKFNEFNEIGMNAQQGYFTLANYMGDASDAIIEFTNNLQYVYNLDASNLINGMRGILGMVSNMHLAREEAQGIVKAFTSFGQDLSAFSGYSVDEVVGQLESAVNLGNIRVTSPLIRALDLTKEDVEAFRELNSVEERAQYLLNKGQKIRGTYEKWIETSAGKVEQLKGSTDILNTSLGKLATGLYAKVAPALTAIVNLITKCVDGIAELVHIDLTDIEENSGGVVKSYEDIAGSLEDVGNAADKASGKTRSFDDLILVDKGTNTGNFNAEDFDISEWLKPIKKDKTELEIILDEFYALLSDKKYKEAGKYLAESINNLLSDIDWSDLDYKFKAGGASIASLLSGLFEDKDPFSNIGTILGKIPNTLMNGISGFLFGDDNSNGFDFSGFGEALGTAWKEYWDTFDSTELGHILEGVFTGAVDFVNGWLTGGGLTNITSSIGNIISSFFTHFSEEDAEDTANAIVGFIDNIIDAVQNLLDIIGGNPKIEQGIKNVIKKSLEKIKNNSGDWGSTLNELITSVLDFASELLLENQNIIAVAVGNFLEKLDILDILNNWFVLKWSGFTVKIKSLIDGLAKDVIGFLINPLGKIGEFLGKMLGQIAENTFGSFEESLQGILGNPILNSLTGGLGYGAKIGNWIVNNIKLPWMATGGIAYRATPVVIGDGGMEAVLPLTQNTGWAKQVADLININLSNNKNNSGGTVVIDMSGLNKPFYSRSELMDFMDVLVEGFKAYGLNIASLI